LSFANISPSRKQLARSLC